MNKRILEKMNETDTKILEGLVITNEKIDMHTLIKWIHKQNTKVISRNIEHLVEALERYADISLLMDLESI